MPNKRIRIQRDVVLPRVQETRDWWLCVIAIEGERREKQYFNSVHSQFSKRRVKIDILPTRHGDSTPASVLDRLKRYRQENNLMDEDQCWLVFDVDFNTEPALRTICEQAKVQHFRLAVSNPCFEFWLFLHRFEAAELDTAIHQVPVAQRPNNMKSILNDVLQGYNYHSLLPRDFLAEITGATRRAKQKEARRRTDYPRFPGSDVYKVVETLLDLPSPS